MERFPSVRLTLRSGATATGRKLRGYAAVFDTLSENLGGFREQIRKGAFTEAIQNGDVVALWAHDPAQVIGRQSANTLQLEEDSHGLYFECDPPSWAAPYLETVERGDVTQMSFGFTVPSGGDEWGKRGADLVRTVVKAALREISLVAWPAYPVGTMVEVRSLYGDLPAIPELDTMLPLQRELASDHPEGGRLKGPLGRWPGAGPASAGLARRRRIQIAEVRSSGR